jgi:small-conductance mechanosensitive channel
MSMSIWKGGRPLSGAENFMLIQKRLFNLYSAVGGTVFRSGRPFSAVLSSFRYSRETHPPGSDTHGCLTLHFAKNSNEKRTKSLKSAPQTAVFRYKGVACVIIVCLAALLITGVPVQAAKSDRPSAKTPVEKQATAPVILDGKELFSVQNIKTVSAEERAKAIGGRIKKIAEDFTVQSDSITSADSDISTDVVAGEHIILSVTDRDALAEGKTRQDLAADYARIIGAAVVKYRVDYSRKSIYSGALYGVIATLAFVLILGLLVKLFRKLNNLINTRYKDRIHAIHIGSAELVQTQRVIALINGSLSVFRFVTVVIIVFTYVNFLLSFFPWTRPFANQLLGYVLLPLKTIGQSLISEIPNLIFIAVLVLITRYILKFMHIFFKQIEQESLSLQGFYPEWARPTSQLLTFAVIVFMAVVAFPYIPGSESPAFKGISIFIGVLFSLGSQSVVSNTVAGVVMTYRRAFKVGDRIQVGEVIGDVTEIRHQVTFIRTIKNEKISMPNSTLLNSPITNYSYLAREQGLILHTAVTIGYDAPWRQVHELLLMAAGRTDGLLREPSPFVLQTSLDDFYVRYELNVYTDAPQNMARFYSELHSNIQVCFNEYGVQIMSPHYLGDPTNTKVVPRDQWYAPPAKRPIDKG